MCKFCTVCGKVTITKCPNPNCNAAIRGDIRGMLVLHQKNAKPPAAFCHNCGQPYPWTEANIQAARELALEVENISDKDKQILADNIEDMMKELAEKNWTVP